MRLFVYVYKSNLFSGTENEPEFCHQTQQFDRKWSSSPQNLVRKSNWKIQLNIPKVKSLCELLVCSFAIYAFSYCLLQECVRKLMHILASSTCQLAF